MTLTQTATFIGLIAHFFTPPDGRVSVWVEQNVVFNEPGCSGPFSFSDREYLREPVDCWGSDSTDVVLVFGTRCGKTRTLYCGLGYTVEKVASRILYVKPTTKGTAGAEGDARTRFIPMLRATPALAKYIPSGAQRHNFKTPQQIIHGSIIDWTGSNSVANLASNPARVVIQDEVDKFNTTRKRGEDGAMVEADASSLADERCKEFANPKRFKASTPTLVSGLIWQELMKSDLRRYYVPCPHCSKHVIFAWSKQYTVLPLTGDEAFIRWDSEAKGVDGVWDLERVDRTAHMVCPHCEGKIWDGQKAEMIRNGEWKPTRVGAPGYRGYHLPSMYCQHLETSFGRMAVRFLKQKRSLQGLQGFINSDLAEPYQSQDLSSERVELVRQVQIEITAEWRKLITADAQQKWPYLWFVLRAWNGGDSEGISAGHFDTFDELRALQIEHGIPDAGVVIDSGFGSKREAEVYRNCANFGAIIPRKSGFPLHIGWMPSKGMPSRKRWRDPETKQSVPYFLRAIDPFMGTTEAGKLEINLFEFASMYYEDLLAALRDSKRGHGYRWAVSDQMDKSKFQDGSTYWKHLDGHIIKRIENRITGMTTEQWSKRHRDWPDHLLDCEILQVAQANFFGWFKIDQPKAV